MKVWTWEEIKNEVNIQYDLEDENFISDEELIQYGNQALDRVEQIIMRLFQDTGEHYLFSTSELILHAGVAEISLPPDIYAHKLVQLWYKNGSEEYEIKRIRSRTDHRYLERGDKYMYRIINRSELGGPKIQIFPTPTVSLTVSDGIEYIRNLSRITSDQSEIDAPEAASYIIQFVKDKCANKERVTPDAGDSAALINEEQRLVETLTEMVPDEDNVMLADYSFYNETMDEWYFS